MTEEGARASGEQQAPVRAKSSGYELFIKIAIPVILMVGAATTKLLWAHEGRMTKVETQRTLEKESHKDQHEAIQRALDVQHRATKEALGEIKADIKTLLKGNR